jgi:hypothetical protein
MKKKAKQYEIILSKGTEILNDNQFIQVDISNLCECEKKDISNFTGVIPDKDFHLRTNRPLTEMETKVIIDFALSKKIYIKAKKINGYIYDFYFGKNNRARVDLESIYTHTIPQRVDDDTYWFNGQGIEYLLKTYDKPLKYKNKVIVEVKTK